MTLVPTLDVADFGAVGNGVADDTEAIRRALAAVPTVGTTVVFPSGTYKVTGTLSVPRATRLLGLGTKAYVAAGGYVFAGGAELVAGTPGMTVVSFPGLPGQGIELRGPMIDGVSVRDPSKTATLVDIRGTNHWKIQNCTLTGGLVGVKVDTQNMDASWGAFDHCTISHNLTGILYAGGAGVPGLVVHGGAIMVPPNGVGVHFATSSYYNRITSVKFDVHAGGVGVKFDKGISNVVQACGFELHGATGVRIRTNGIVVSACQFQGNTAGSTGIDVDAARGVQIAACSWNTLDYCVKLGPTSRGAHVSGGIIHYAGAPNGLGIVMEAGSMNHHISGLSSGMSFAKTIANKGVGNTWSHLDTTTGKVV